MKKKQKIDKGPWDKDDNYVVIYQTLRCPRCNSDRVRCYCTKSPSRYHICKKCKYTFKSVESNWSEFMKLPDYYKILPRNLAESLWNRGGLKSWKDVLKADDSKLRGLPGIGEKGIMRLRLFKLTFGNCNTISDVESGAWKHRQGTIQKATQNKDRLICKCGEDKFIIDKRCLEIICPICGEEYCFQGEVIEKWY